MSESSGCHPGVKIQILFLINEPQFRISVLASPKHTLHFLWYVLVPLGLKEERCVIDGAVIG